MTKSKEYYLKEILTDIKYKRTSAGLSMESILSDLQSVWGASIANFEIIRNLESINYLKTILPRGHWHSGSQRVKEENRDDLSSIQRYSFRMSSLLNFLGYIPEERKAIFSVLSELDSRIKYKSNNISPSDKVIEWLNGTYIKEKHWNGFRSKFKPRNIVY